MASYFFVAWLLGILFAINTPEISPLVSQSVAFFWFPLWLVFHRKSVFLSAPVFVETPSIVLAIFVLGGAWFVSAMISQSPGEALGYTFAAIIGFFSCAAFWSYGQNALIKGLLIYAVIGISIIGLLYIMDSDGGGRFGSFRNPNGIALIVMGLVVSAFAVKNIYYRTILQIVALSIILMTGSRSPLIGSIIALSVYFVFSWSKLNSRQREMGFFVISILAVICIINFDSIQALGSDHLSFDDKYRGLGTGFSGRVYAWERAIEIWSNQPWLGVGFKNHYLYYINFQAYGANYTYGLSSAHNGYLALLAEVGIIGLLPIIYIVYTRIRRLLVLAKDGHRCAIIGVSLISGYLFVNVFENFFISMGNPTSILFLIFLMMPERSVLKLYSIASPQVYNKKRL